MFMQSSGSHLADYWCIHPLGLHVSGYLKGLKEARKLAKLLGTMSLLRMALGYLELALECHRESLSLTLFADVVLEMVLCYSKSWTHHGFEFGFEKELDLSLHSSFEWVDRCDMTLALKQICFWSLEPQGRGQSSYQSDLKY